VRPISSQSSLRISGAFLGLVATTVAGGALAALTTGPPRTAGIVLLVLGGWGIALCLHEFGHAFTAYRGGDRSVRAKGYLTLDIRRYTDPVMSLLLPLGMLALGGIPLPGGAVWINRHALRSPAIDSAVSLVGPLTNLALGGALAAAVNTGQLPDGLRIGLSYLALVQVLAFVLNILPVPGLDGFAIVAPYLSPKARRYADTIGLYAVLALFFLLVTMPAANTALFHISFTIFGWLSGDPAAAAAGLREFQFWR